MKTAFLFFAMGLFWASALSAKTVGKDWTLPLHKALEGVTRLKVRSGGVCHRQPKEEKVLLDLRKEKEIGAFVNRIRIDPNDSGFHCMCCGEPTLEFYQGDVLVVSLGYHHGRSLRWLDGQWAGDGLLSKESGDFLIKWLADQGVMGPKEEMEETLRLEKQAMLSQEKWLAAMPASLKPFWNSLGGLSFQIETGAMAKALAAELPGQDQQILALLAWFGAGEGPWSGFPSYESVAEELLLLYNTESLLSAIRKAELSEAQLEGAARLFGGWRFSQKRPEDLRLLDGSLKKRFLEHSLKSDSEDKRERASQAFGT